MVFFLPMEWCESHDTPCGKRFLCQHQRRGEITTISPVRRRISDVTLHRITKAKGLKRSPSAPPPIPSYTQKKKKKTAIFETIPPSVITVGEGEQIASPAFRLKSKRRFTKQKAKRFLRVSAGSPKRNICLGEAVPLIKAG